MQEGTHRGGRPRSEERLEPFMIRLPSSAVEELREIARREASPLATVLRRFVMERLEQVRQERGR